MANILTLSIGFLVCHVARDSWFRTHFFFVSSVNIERQTVVVVASVGLVISNNITAWGANPGKCLLIDFEKRKEMDKCKSSLIMDSQRYSFASCKKL